MSTNESEHTEPAAQASVPARRRRWGGQGSIQSKLLVMLLLSSILSAAVVGFFGYRSGTHALRDEAFERLTELRKERTRQIQDYAARFRSSAIINSRGFAVDALQDFEAGFDSLDAASGAQRQKLGSYYSDTFIPQLQEFSDGTVQADSFIPDDPRVVALQAAYTASSDDFDAKLELDDAKDGSAWSKANLKYQPFFREVIRGSGADDILLIDLDGTIVWSAYKGVDLGTNVKTGPYRGAGLEKVFDQALHSNSRDYTAVSDLERYQPSYNLAAGFVASPIVDGDTIIGVYVAQIPIQGINNVMTGGTDGQVHGLGTTGETYLAGPDDLMRSTSRVLVEDPKEYLRRAVDRGTAREVAQRAIDAGSTVMIQPVRSSAQDQASDGKTGTVITTDYLGREVLDSYGPAEIPGLDWTVIAKIDTSEAFEPVHDFARSMLVATAAVVLLIAAASVLMARVFTSPLNRLITGVRAVAGGDLGARVEAGSKDEFGDLAAAFNDMSASLRSKQDLLDAEQAENEHLLRSLMPESVATRYRGGETGIVDEHQNVTVALVDVEGFDEFAASLDTAEALALRDTIARGIDEAARSAGVDKVRGSGTSVVVSSGLVVQRVDHVRRVADFAGAVAALVDRFNAQHGALLTVRSGIDTGTVRSGLLGPNGVVYDLWGAAVNLAYRLRSVAGEPGIYASDAVKERLVGAFDVEQVGTVDDNGSARPVWRLIPGGA